MKLCTTQFLYCCEQQYISQFKAFARLLRKDKGRFVNLTEEPEYKGKDEILFESRTQSGLLPIENKFHKKCKTIGRCTIQYTIPTILEDL